MIEADAGGLEPGERSLARAGDGAAERAPSPWRPARVALVVLIVGLAVTAALAVVAQALYDRNEDRLLRLRVRELGLVLSGALPSSEIPLASAADWPAPAATAKPTRTCGPRGPSPQ